MTKSLYVMTAWLTTFTASIVGILVYLKNPRQKINKRWAVMSLSIAIWSLFLGFMFNSQDIFSCLLHSRILMYGALLIPVTFYHFVLVFLEKESEKKEKYILFFAYIFTALFLLLNFGNLFVKGVNYEPFVNCFYPNASNFFILYILMYFLLSGYSCFLMYQATKITKGQKNNQIKYVLFASMVGFLGGASTFPLWYQIKMPPLGSHFVWLYALTITYSILRHRLMDITVAVTRTGIFVAVYTLVLGLPFAVAFWLKYWLIGIFNTEWWGVPLGLMAVLATVGPFIYIYLERKAEATLLKEQKRYQDTLKQASIGMTRIRNLKKLLNLIVHIVTKTVRISYAAIYLFDVENNEYVLQVCRDTGKAAFPKLAADNPVISWIKAKREPLIYEEIKRKMQDSNDRAYNNLEENMRTINASVIVPSFLEDKLLGLLVLADKVSGKIYTPEDLNVFQVLASQAALAIENAQFYEEAKEMQEQIAQAEKMATIGTMADGLSHQINNRFYALSLIAGDTIDTIKMTDTSNCSPEIKEMIAQINHALERVQANVLQGGEVVRGILKYTRKGDAGLEALTLDQILDNTLEMVQYKVKLAELDIIRDFSKEIPNIKGNLVQLQEVFFNFIDNAYDAIVERRTTLKEEGYRGKIIVRANPFNSALKIEIEDNGMGIKAENIKKVFAPFFTTKVSSRRGTGLGLYVINKIIIDTHKGKIGFESTHQQGTKFIIELPIAL